MNALTSPFSVLEPEMMRVLIRRPDGGTYTQEYVAKGGEPVNALRAARIDIEEQCSGNVVVAVDLGQWGWATAEELDAEADEEARAADDAHDGDGEPYPVRLRDVGVRP